MKITIAIERVYGVVKYYPACETSQKLAQLAGTKTLTRASLNIIESLGYKINVKPQKMETL